MYKYKRGIDNIKDLRDVKYILSNNKSVCLSTSEKFDVNKPYNGLYIKNGKIMLANLCEKFEVKNKEYRITNITTNMQSIDADEYITEIDLSKNKIEYDIGPISYSKRFDFKKNTDILMIEYNVVNKENSKVKFQVIPMFTYRDLYHMKNESMLKFTQRKAENGVVINLSVMNSDDIILKSKEFVWDKEIKTVKNIKHTFVDDNLDKEEFTEDLMFLGLFEVKLKAKEEKKLRIYISAEDFNIEDVNADVIINENEYEKERLLKDIDINYIELRNLKISINNLDLDEKLVQSMPYLKDYNEIITSDEITDNINTRIADIENITNIVKSIDGMYLTFNNLEKAKKILIKIRRYIKNIDANIEKDGILKTDEMNILNTQYIKYVALLKLWYVEIVNKFIQKSNETFLFEDIIRDIIYFVLDENYKTELLKDIEIVALLYNAIRIYQDMLKEENKEDIKMFEVIHEINTAIKDKFWCEEKRVLRRNLDESQVYANIQMIYTLSLSYPCLLDDMPFKVLDTIFKELYTPYGLRTFSKNSPKNDGLIYPKYMAHFVKANLRQNGVTRASQKIAYNLVKELMQEIDKYVNGGIKRVYHEKGINIDKEGYDLLTNAEMIRLYDMLT